MIKLLVPKMPNWFELTPYLQRIDESRWYSNFGSLERELRARLEEKYGAHVVTVSSCTAGLELMYRHMRRDLGFQSIRLPSLTFAATALAAHREGLEVEFEDVDAETWTHPAVAGFGVPEVGPFVDAAAAFGEQRVGPGQTVVFSLHATKMVGAGEGGYIVTHDRDLAEHFRRQTNFGFDGGISAAWGTNAKMSEYACAVALASLDGYDRGAWLRLDRWYRWHLPVSVTEQKRWEGAYPILAVKLPVIASAVMHRLAAAGIETRRWYCPPAHWHPLFLGRPCGPLPVTNELSQRLLGLPYHLYLTEADVRRVCEELARAVEEENRNV